MKKTILSSLIIFSTLNALEMPPMPPNISLDTSKKSNSIKKEDKKLPKSCELIPPMVIMLPPPMEKQLNQCKNELFKPKKEFVEKQLKKLLKKDIKVKTIESVEKFVQLYKVTYNGGVILTNKEVNAFIKQ